MPASETSETAKRARPRWGRRLLALFVVAVLAAGAAVWYFVIREDAPERAGLDDDDLGALGRGPSGQAAGFGDEGDVAQRGHAGAVHEVGHIGHHPAHERPPAWRERN